MKIATSLPMPKTMVNDNGIRVSLVPVASEPSDAWYNQANISAKHADFADDIGRKLPSNGVGLTRIQVCVNQCGLPPAGLLAKAGVGKGSKQAKKLRS